MGSARGKALGKRSEEIKQAQATLCGPGIFFELVVHEKSRDLKGVTAYRTDVVDFAAYNSSMPTKMVLTVLHLNSLLALTMTGTPEETRSLAEATVNLPVLQKLYVLCTSAKAAPMVPLLMTELTLRRVHNQGMHHHLRCSLKCSQAL